MSSKRNDYDGHRHYTQPWDGQEVPSVTTILDVLDKPALMRWAARRVAEESQAQASRWRAMEPEAAVAALKGIPWADKDNAAKVGTDAHAFAESCLNLERPIAEPTPAEAWDNDRAVKNVVAILTGLGIEPILIEPTLYGPGYAGTADLFAKVNGVPMLLDWKSASGVYPDNALQLAAYKYSSKAEQPGQQLLIDTPQVASCGILHIPKTGSASVVELNVGGVEWTAFLAAKLLWTWQKHRAKEVLMAPVGPEGFSQWPANSKPRRRRAAK